MFHIASKPPPTPDDPSKYSADFLAFVTAALEKEPTQRPSSSALLELPFVSASRRDALGPLIASAQWYKANPRPQAPPSPAG